MSPLTTTALRIAAANLRRRIAAGGGLSHAEMRALAAVLDEAVSDDGPVQRTLTTAPLADQMRALSPHLPGTHAVQLDRLALIVGRMERTMDEIVADAQEDEVLHDLVLNDLAFADPKVVSISCGIVRSLAP